MLDILTFYQERLANEAYLRTATQTNSLIELSRLIGYQPAPGVSAATYLAFTLRQTPGTPPDPKAPPIVIPQGTKVQSVPPQGQQPQTFETAADILAKPDWNALQVQTGLPWGPQIGDTFVYLSGTSTQFQPGDAILVVGNERAFPPYTSENWDVRIVSSVTADTQNNRTCITWKEGLGSAKVTPAQAYPKFYAFRQRASLFGYNAIQPMLLDQKILTTLTPLNDSGTDWNFLSSQASANSDLYGRQLIDLDFVYAKIVPNGWIALIVPDDDTQRSPSGLVTLYQVESVTTVSRSDYGTSARITRAAVDVETYLRLLLLGDTADLGTCPKRGACGRRTAAEVSALRDLLKLETLRSDLGAIQVVAVSGNRQKLSVNPGVTTLWFIPDDGSIPRWFGGWRGVDAHAAAGHRIVHDQHNVLLAGIHHAGATCTFKTNMAGPERCRASRLATSRLCLRPGVIRRSLSTRSWFGVDNASDPAHTTLKLQSPLANCYDRPSTTVNANVGLASHGRSVSDILGNGGAATPNQMFTLKQSPLTFVQAADAHRQRQHAASAS